MTERSKAYREGRRARQRKQPKGSNPFRRVRTTAIRGADEQAELQRRWDEGWNDQDWIMEIEAESVKRDAENKPKANDNHAEENEDSD